ncbi:uncharacterized protein [Procambarus clarkii]|uniref:uncharacterized protein n=1 Tax=Procambarus clarkii TaxID=6728 RepID=UPI003744946C
MLCRWRRRDGPLTLVVVVVAVVWCPVTTADLESRLRDTAISTWSQTHTGDLYSRGHLHRHPTQAGGHLQPPLVAFGDLGRPQDALDRLGQDQDVRGDLQRPHEIFGIPRRPHDLRGSQGLPHSNGSDLERPLGVHDDLPGRSLSANGDSGQLQEMDGVLRRPWGINDGVKRPKDVQTDLKWGRSKPERLRGLPGKRGDQRWHDLHPDIWYDPEYAANHRWEDEGYSSTTSTEFTRRTFDKHIITSINLGHNTTSNINHGINDHSNINYDIHDSINHGINDHSNINYDINDSINHGINDHSNINYDINDSINHGINDHSNINYDIYERIDTNYAISDHNNMQDYNEHHHNNNNNARGNYGNRVVINQERHQHPLEQPKHLTQTSPQTPKSAPVSRTPWLSLDMLIGPLGHLAMFVSALTVLFLIFSAMKDGTGSPADGVDLLPGPQERELETVFHRIRDLLLPEPTILKDDQGGGDGMNRSRRSLAALRRAHGETSVFLDRGNHSQAVSSGASGFHPEEHVMNDDIHTSINRDRHWRANNISLSDIRAGDHRGRDIRAGDHRGSDIRAGDHRASDIRAGDHRASDIRARDHRASDIRAGDHRASDIRAGDHRASDIRAGGNRTTDIKTTVSGMSDIPTGGNAMTDIGADNLKLRQFGTLEHGIGRQIDPLSQIALSAAMVLGAYAGYAFINVNKPLSTKNTQETKSKTSRNKNEEETEGFVMGDGSEEPLAIRPVPSSLNLSSIHLDGIKHPTLPKLSKDRLMTQFATLDDDDSTSQLQLEASSSKLPMDTNPRLNISVWNMQTTQSSASSSYFLPPPSDLLSPDRLGRPAVAATTPFSESDLSSGVSSTSGFFSSTSTSGSGAPGDEAEATVPGIKDFTPHFAPIATSNSGAQNSHDLFSLAAWDKAILPLGSASHTHYTTEAPSVNLYSNIHHSQHIGTTHSDQQEYDKPPITFSFWKRISRPEKQEETNVEVLPAIEYSSTYLKPSTLKPKSNNHLTSDSSLTRPTEIYETSTWVQNQQKHDNYKYDHDSGNDHSKDDRPEIYLTTALPKHVRRQPSLWQVSSDDYTTPRNHIIQTYTRNTQLPVQALVTTHTPSERYTSQKSTKSSTLAQNVFEYSVPLRVIRHQTASGNDATQEENVSLNNFHSSSGSFQIYHRFPEPPQESRRPTNQSPYQSDVPNNDDFDYDENDALDAQTFNTLLKLARREWNSLKSSHGNPQQLGSSYKKRNSAGDSHSSTNHRDVQIVTTEEGATRDKNTMISSDYSQGGPEEDISSYTDGKKSDQDNSTTLPMEVLNPVTLARLDHFLQKLLANLNTTTPSDGLAAVEDVTPDEADRNSKSSRDISKADNNLKDNALLEIFSRISTWKNRRHRSKAAGSPTQKDRVPADHVPRDGFQGAVDISTVTVDQSLHRYEVTTPVEQPATWITSHDLSTWSSVTDPSNSSPQEGPGRIYLQNQGSTWLDGDTRSSFLPSLDLDDVGSQETLSQSHVVPTVAFSITTRSEGPGSVTKTNLGSSRPWIRSSKHRAKASTSVAREENLHLQVDKTSNGPQRQAQTGKSWGLRGVPQGGTDLTSEVRVNVTPSAAYISVTPPGISSENAHIRTQSFSDTTELSSINPSIVEGKNEDTPVTEAENTSKPFATSLQERLTIIPDKKQMENANKNPTFGFGLEMRGQPIPSPGERSIPQKPPRAAPSHIIIPAITPPDSRSPNFQSFYLPDPPKYSAPKSWSASSPSSFSDPDIPSAVSSQDSTSYSFQYSPTPPSSSKSSYPTRSTTHVSKQSPSSFRFSTEVHPALLTSQTRASSGYILKNPANLPSTVGPSTVGLTSTLQDTIPTTIPVVDILENLTSPPSDSVSLMSKFLCRHAVYHRACALCMEEVGHRSECLVRMP